MNQNPRNIWGVVPAAGVGRRMASEIPKQYLKVYGKSILEYSLQSLLSHPRIHKVVVVVAAHDHHWSSIQSIMAQDRVLTAQGAGTERCHSVYAGLLALAAVAQPEDWVLVHDAVRPCVRYQEIDRLILSVENYATGGLLALPVRDTLKLVNAQGIVTGTLDRTGIWQAQTPQMFRLGELTAALAHAINSGHQVTDEASAMEFSGGEPIMVPGHINNIKVTDANDLLWLEHYLRTK